MRTPARCRWRRCRGPVPVNVPEPRSRNTLAGRAVGIRRRSATLVAFGRRCVVPAEQPPDRRASADSDMVPALPRRGNRPQGALVRWNSARPSGSGALAGPRVFAIIDVEPGCWCLHPRSCRGVFISACSSRSSAVHRLKIERDWQTTTGRSRPRSQWRGLRRQFCDRAGVVPLKTTLGRFSDGVNPPIIAVPLGELLHLVLFQAPPPSKSGRPNGRELGGGGEPAGARAFCLWRDVGR